MVDSIKEDRAIELYTEFRKELRTAPIPEIAPYPRPFEGGTFNGLAMPFHTVAQDALREIANSINDFGRYIHYLHAWHIIFERVSENDRYNLLLEHVRPFTVLCLGAPQALRGRLIYAATAGSYHANRFLTWPDGLPKWDGGHTSMKTAKAMSEKWAAWPALAAELNILGQDQLSQATDDFRNEHEHGHPRGIGIGYISTVKREKGHGGITMHMKQGNPNEPREVWSFGEQKPMQLAELLPLLEQEHATALRAFKAYLALIEEQHTATLSP